MTVPLWADPRYALAQSGHGVATLAATADGYALALRLAAAAMVAGAILVAALFEKAGPMAPGQQPPGAANSPAGQEDETAETGGQASANPQPCRAEPRPRKSVR